MKSRTITNIIRWLMVIPSALIAHYIFYNIAYYTDTSWLARIFGFGFMLNMTMVMSFVVAGASAVVAGSIMAPCYRKYVSIVLASAVSVIMIIGCCVVIMKFENYSYWDIVCDIANIIGAIVAVACVHSIENQTNI